jgi:hypothetical protein
MKKITQLAVVAALTGASFAASAWWGWGGPWGGPWGGAPYWGGYAPYAYAPAYGYAPYAYAPVPAPWGQEAFDPRSSDPFAMPEGEFAHDPFMPPMFRQMFKQADDSMQQALKASEERRTASMKQAEERRAQMEQRRAEYGSRPAAPTAAPEAAPAAAPAEISGQ